MSDLNKDTIKELLIAAAVGGTDFAVNWFIITRAILIILVLCMIGGCFSK